MMTESEYIGAIRRGDREAFNAFCLDHYVALLSYAHLFVRDSWAEDVVQDVLFSVWEHRKSLKDGGSLSAYLLRSVYNRCQNYLKRARIARSFYDERISEIMAGYYSPDTNPVMVSLFRHDLHNKLETAISSLSPRVQEVFRMSYLEDIPNKEIAHRLGLSLSTVENHMYSALKQLRLLLSEG